MTEKEILELRDLAEVGKVQFKERIVDNYDIATEMCAMILTKVLQKVTMVVPKVTKVLQKVTMVK